MDGFILPAWLGCLSEFAGMDLFLIPDRNSAPLQQSLLRSLQSYLNGIDPQESAAPPDAADNLAELYRIGKTMEGCVPVSDGETERASSCIAPFMAASAGSPGGETVCHVLNSVSSNLNTEATCVTTMALPDVAAWQLCGRQNASVTPTSSVSSSRGSSSPTIAAHCLAVNGGAAKVGKKRSRASRRAPTTLLNTDTSNFRAMVQQFTGISNAPFASSASNFSSADSPAHDSPPKPFAQRLLGQNFYAATTTNNSNPDNLFPPLAKFPPQHSSLPILPFQSLHAENMNSPFLLPNFFSNKGAAHGISEGQLISAMNAGPVLVPNPSTALSFGPT